jgi:hypothetical protein
MSDLGGIGILAALLYLFAIFCAFIKGSIEQMRKNKKPKEGNSKPIVSDKEEQELSHEDSEFDGEILFDQPMFPSEDFDDGDDP